MNKTNWKEYFNTLLLSVVAYLLIDIHLTFKGMIKEVEHLKEQVMLHEYILNSENKDNKKPNKYKHGISEAILPNQDTKIKRFDVKAKHSNS